MLLVSGTQCQDPSRVRGIWAEVWLRRRASGQLPHWGSRAKHCSPIDPPRSRLYRKRLRRGRPSVDPRRPNAAVPTTAAARGKRRPGAVIARPRRIPRTAPAACATLPTANVWVNVVAIQKKNYTTKTTTVLLSMESRKRSSPMDRAHNKPKNRNQRPRAQRRPVQMRTRMSWIRRRREL
jgi:hypothetical protein